MACLSDAAPTGDGSFESKRERAVTRRRGHLVTAPNPGRRNDYVVTLAGMMEAPEPAAEVGVTLRYVPDRVVLRPAAFAAYIEVLREASWDGLEELATTILGDVNNELIPRWVHVSLKADNPEGGYHAVDLDDRQPNWDNPSLLARLATARSD
ncbi:MAG: hypothetical protein ACE5H8_10445 [Alphaproteobacteria bacterium]